MSSNTEWRPMAYSVAVDRVLTELPWNECVTVRVVNVEGKPKLGMRPDRRMDRRAMFRLWVRGLLR